MLVLSRKEGERLIVGDDITITVTKCGRNRVVIGIDAPKEVPIKRAEIADADVYLSSNDSDSPVRVLSVA